MRISRVYTRTGDRGKTGLVGGRRVGKDDPRIEAYGDVDELNSVLGLARAFHDGGEPAQRIEVILKHVQNELFSVGADLATRAEDRWEGMVRLGDDDVGRLEEWIDALNEDLGPLQEFILPGGGPVGAFLHQARTVCRRAERRTYTLMQLEEDVGDVPLRYLNRLSDLLFVLARWSAHSLGEPEFLWEKPTS